MTHRLVRQFLNATGSITGDYGRTAVTMVCPNCRKVVDMKVTTANLICPECKYKEPRWISPSPNPSLPPVAQLAAAYRPNTWRDKRQASERKTISLSETDVARVLQAVAIVECWKIGRNSTSNHKEYGLARWDRTPEGWPVPSRRLMEKIKKLL